MSTRWRIMVVDDDRDILELIRLSLGEKYSVVAFHEPLTALQALDMVEPDLVILDIMMPRLTGYQFIEQIKTNRRFADIPVVFLSAKDANRDIKYGYKLGAAVYLTKPFQPDRLLRNIDSLFQQAPPVQRPKKFVIEEVIQRLSVGTEFGVSFQGGTGAGPSRMAPVGTPKSGEHEVEGQEQAKNPDWLD